MKKKTTIFIPPRIFISFNLKHLPYTQTITQYITTLYDGALLWTEKERNVRDQSRRKIIILEGVPEQSLDGVG